MKKKLQKFAFLIFALTVLSSCKKPEDDSDLIAASECKNTTQWLKNGHKLAYKNFPIFLPGDSLFSEFKEEKPGIFRTLQRVDKGATVTSLYFQACGNIIYQSSVISMDNKYEVYRLDGNIGENWSYMQDSGVGYSVTNKTTITEKNVNLIVPAGTFKCIKLLMVTTYPNAPVGGLKTEMWFNEKYGMIKTKGYSAHYELAKANY